MHYYQFNIGDYASHTKGLNLLEDLAYRRLLDYYYLAERPFNGCSTDVARLIGMRDNVGEVDYVLRTYFTNDNEKMWINTRADKEINAYKDKSTKASVAGKASAQRRNNGRSTNVQRTFNGRSTDVQPNIKHKPLNIKHIKDIAPPDGVLESVWEDFVKQRKAKKASITPTAIKGIEREARKAGISLNDALQEICSRGWAGFKADWMTDKTKTSWADKQREWVAEATGKAYEPDVFDIAIAQTRGIK